MGKTSECPSRWLMESVRPSMYSIARISSVLLRQIEKNHQDERRIESIERAGNRDRALLRWTRDYPESKNQWIGFDAAASMPVGKSKRKQASVQTELMMIEVRTSPTLFNVIKLRWSSQNLADSSKLRKVTLESYRKRYVSAAPHLSSAAAV